MSRFEYITEEWWWFPTLDRGYPIAYGHTSTVNVDIVNYPGFKEFLGVDSEELERCMFELTSAYIDRSCVLALKYTSRIVSNIYAKLKITLQTEEKHVAFRAADEYLGGWATLDEFKTNHPEYFSTCDKIRAWGQQAAEIEKLRAENAALRAEIEHLRYRPGGPGYDEAAGHFAALAQ